MTDDKESKLHLLNSTQEYIQYNPIFNIYYKWFIKDFLNKEEKRWVTLIKEQNIKPE